jgi:hypothetical protein
MRLAFLGGAGTVTGSKYLLDSGGRRVLTASDHHPRTAGLPCPISEAIAADGVGSARHHYTTDQCRGIGSQWRRTA